MGAEESIHSVTFPKDMRRFLATIRGMCAEKKLKHTIKRLVRCPMSYLMKLLNQLKKQLLKDFGKKCKEYCFGCAVCGVWRAYEELESAYFFTDNSEIKRTLYRPHK